MQNFDKYLESLDEGKIVLKRRYTENHPEKNVRKGANIRNTIIEALRDKKLTLSEFNEIVAQHSKSPNKWAQRNKRFFKIEEDNVRLSRYGNKIAKTIQPVNEKNHDKKSVLKALGKSDDAMILYRGQEYIIYNPDNGNDENTEMWGDKTVFALDQDGDEIEVAYKDIERIDASHQINLDEARVKNFRKVKAGDVGQDYNGEDVTIVAVGKLGKLMKYDDTGMAEDGLSQGYLDKNDDAVAVESPEGGYALFTYGEDGVVVNESVNEAKAPKNWDSQFTMKAIEAYNNGEFDLEDDKSIAEWDKEYNGGRAPKPAFNTKEVVSYAIETGKKPNGDKMDESFNEAFIGPFVFNDKMSDDELKAMYDGALDGYANHQKGFQHAKSKYKEAYQAIEKILKKRGVKVDESVVNEGVHPKIKKAMKAVEKGETVYGENIRFPGRFKILRFTMGGAMAVIDYEDGKKPYEMAAMNIAIDKMKFESVEINERAKATQMLKDVAKGFASEVEGIKLSKEMAQAYLDWLSQSAYGKKYDGLPFDHIFKASFNWGIDRYTKNLKGEYKELKQQAKAMKESTIYTDFSNFVSESYLGEEVSVELNEMKEPKCSNKEGHLYKKIDKDGTVECVHCGLRNSLSESVEINEALKSSKLRNLLSMKKSPKDLFKAIYGATKIALDKVEDHQVVDIDPKQGPKQDGYVFYYTTQEKDNPHAPDSYYNASFPANTLLALAKGKKVFYVRHNYNRRGPNTYSLTTDPKGGYTRSSSATDIGPNKSYSGYDASGLGSLARVISIADAAFVVNPDALETSHDKIKQRSQAKEGAIAFKDAREFKDANMARYKEILTQRSKSLDVDKEVIKAIEEVADIMKDGVKNKKKNKWNEIIMGTGKDGRDFKINDLTNFTSNLMADYERWSRYMKDAELAKERMEKDGADQRDEQWEIKYNEKEAAQYSKSIKDRLRKLKNRNLAW